MSNVARTVKRVGLTRMLSVAWGLVDRGERIIRVAERVEWVSDGRQLRTRLAQGLMTRGERLSARGVALEYAVDRWARAFRIPMDEVVRPLAPQLYPH